MGKTILNRRRYIEILRRMTPEQRLGKAFELTDMVRELFRAGVRDRNPDLDPATLEQRTREGLMRWHSKPS